MLGDVVVPLGESVTVADDGVVAADGEEAVFDGDFDWDVSEVLLGESILA